MQNYTAEEKKRKISLMQINLINYGNYILNLWMKKQQYSKGKMRKIETF